jgi:hypothetical protein
MAGVAFFFLITGIWLITILTVQAFQAIQYR